MCIPHFQLYSGVQAYMVSLDQAEGEQGSKGFPWRKWLGLECGGGGDRSAGLASILSR